MCDALSLHWSIDKNTTETSSKVFQAARDKFSERFVIVFPDDLDGLPDLCGQLRAPEYTDERTEAGNRAARKRNVFDSLSIFLSHRSNRRRGHGLFAFEKRASRVFQRFIHDS